MARPGDQFANSTANGQCPCNHSIDSCQGASEVAEMVVIHCSSEGDFELRRWGAGQASRNRCVQANGLTQRPRLVGVPRTTSDSYALADEVSLPM